MISFLERNFTYLVTMTSFIYCILGLVLIFFKSPKTDVYAPYRKSKWLLAAGMWMTSINIWIWLATFNGLWTRENAWVASLRHHSVLSHRHLLYLCVWQSDRLYLYLQTTLQDNSDQVWSYSIYCTHRHGRCSGSV